jgi:hypothetical protein
MCNSIHLNSKPIESEGVGYKVFRKVGDDLCPMSDVSAKPLCFLSTGKNIWSNKIKNAWGEVEIDGDGFCFFLDKEAAIVVLEYWVSCFRSDKFVMLPIKYFQGLCKHIETKIRCNKPDEIALCKEFEIEK